MATQLSDYQRDILIRTMLGEARGEGVEGMADVAQVILNRAGSGRFSSDPARVALQPYQFSTWNKGEGGNRPQQFKASSPIYKKAEQALDAVLSGNRPDYTGGALFYHTPSVRPGWSGEVNRYGTINRNGHVFYPSHPVPPGSLPETAVATLLDTKRRVEPSTPSVMSASLAAQRQLTAALNNNQMTRPGSEYASAYVATPQNSAQQAIAAALANGQKTRPAADFNQGIFAVPPAQARAPQLTQPGQISNSVTGAQVNQNPALAAALQQSIARQGMSKAPISYAGQERQPAPKVTTIGYVPTRPQVSGAVSYAGQERGSTPGRVATAADVAAVPYSQGQTVATLLPPIRQSQAPVNTSQPLTSAQRAAIAYAPPTSTAAPANYNAVTSAQRAALSAVPAAAPKATPQGYSTVTAAQRNALSAVPVVRPVQVPPTAQQVSAGTGFRVNMPQGQPSTVMKDQARLQGGVYPGQNPLTQTGVGTSLSVRPPAITGFPTAASLRPLARSSVGFPTPVAQRPTGGISGFPTPLAQRPVAVQRPAVAPRSILGFPTAVSQRPVSNGAPAALQVTVQGAGTQRAASGSPGRSSGSGYSSSPTYVSASTGRVLTPTVVDRYDPSTNTFSKVQTYK